MSPPPVDCLLSIDYHVALQRRMELRVVFMASAYMFSEEMFYGLINLDQIPKISLGSMVMH